MAIDASGRGRLQIRYKCGRCERVARLSLPLEDEPSEQRRSSCDGNGDRDRMGLITFAELQRFSSALEQSAERKLQDLRAVTSFPQRRSRRRQPSQEGETPLDESR